MATVQQRDRQAEPRGIADDSAVDVLRGIEEERGKRYSPGYSACPDLEDQARIFRLLDPAATIDVTLTSAFQIVPEASTSAIIVHHPAALYYLVKA